MSLNNSKKIEIWRNTRWLLRLTVLSILSLVVSPTFAEEHRVASCHSIDVIAIIKEARDTYNYRDRNKFGLYTDVSQKISNYIPLDCDVKALVTELINGGFELNSNHPEILTEIHLKIPLSKYEKQIMFYIIFEYKGSRVEALKAIIHAPVSYY
ncbi:hypothetical protein [Methylomonas sp. ZR1]|uniref:hypothetical protein n=1 Tax=Methylomonas sp. ZR1 TaxID=1797072 RepID=UPI0014913FA8|nr:hypothetical protein [Methylomonas sp. ZR1]